MESNVTLLSAANKALAVGVNVDGVNRTKVALHRPHVLLIAHVPEVDLEVSRPTRHKGHVSGFNTSAYEYLR
eukprot:1203277-Amorphochlora_amoeboformis.AAC.1